MKKEIITHLYNRNLIKQITEETELKKTLYNEKIKIYFGIDPTSDSLHIGHLIFLIYINKFIEFGNEFIILIGESTGLIGDPSFIKNKRNLYSKIFIEKNKEKIEKQLLNILNINIKENIKILNNKNWLNSINIIDFLYKIGINFSVNDILNRKSIKNRTECKKNKISFTELSYILLQSYDFFYLYNKYNVKLQIGGSDQWNNIIFGINLIKKIYNTKVYGLTFPIITDNNGYKFSKSLKNNIWLDEKKTSPYKFYQFWINISDSYVFNYLKMFTNESLNYIENLEKENKYKNKIIAKEILAKHLTKMIHGENNLNSVLRITNNLFTGKCEFKENDLEQLHKDGIPTIFLKLGINLQQAIVESNIAISNSNAKNIILSNSIKINGIIISKLKYFFSKKDILYNKYTMLCKGKKNYYLIIWK